MAELLLLGGGSSFLTMLGVLSVDAVFSQDDTKRRVPVQRPVRLLQTPLTPRFDNIIMRRRNRNAGRMNNNGRVNGGRMNNNGQNNGRSVVGSTPVVANKNNDNNNNKNKNAAGNVAGANGARGTTQPTPKSSASKGKRAAKLGLAAMLLGKAVMQGKPPGAAPGAAPGAPNKNAQTPKPNKNAQTTPKPNNNAQTPKPNKNAQTTPKPNKNAVNARTSPTKKNAVNQTPQRNPMVPEYDTGSHTILGASFVPELLNIAEKTGLNLTITDELIKAVSDIKLNPVTQMPFTQQERSLLLKNVVSYLRDRENLIEGVVEYLNNNPGALTKIQKQIGSKVPSFKMFNPQSVVEYVARTIVESTDKIVSIGNDTANARVWMAIMNPKIIGNFFSSVAPTIIRQRGQATLPGGTQTLQSGNPGLLPSSGRTVQSLAPAT